MLRSFSLVSFAVLVACGGPVSVVDEAVTDDTLDCATLTVPLDHDDPTGDTIDLIPGS